MHSKASVSKATVSKADADNAVADFEDTLKKINDQIAATDDVEEKAALQAKAVEAQAELDSAKAAASSAAKEDATDDDFATVTADPNKAPASNPLASVQRGNSSTLCACGSSPLCRDGVVSL